MPSYEFQCNKCSKIFNYFYHMKDAPIIGAVSKNNICCGSLLRIFSKTILHVKSYTVEKAQAAANDGIPFGEVPGDDDYVGLGEPDYLGPLP